MTIAEKTPISIKGTVHFLEAGEAAIIRHEGRITRTSTVISIIKAKKNTTQFETLNSLYTVENDRLPFWRRILRLPPMCKSLVSGGE